MPIEIERKFLVKNDSWKKHIVGGYYCKQGYIHHAKGVVRVRAVGDEAYLTLKSLNDGIRRDEFEYKIPITDANIMFEKMLDKNVVEKTRYLVKYEQFIWEVDVFHGNNEGLILVELEVNSVETRFPRPGWLGEEVSSEDKYYNSNLARYPYNTWSA